MGPRPRLLVLRYDNRYLYLLTHLPGPRPYLYSFFCYPGTYRSLVDSDLPSHGTTDEERFLHMCVGISFQLNACCAMLSEGPQRVLFAHSSSSGLCLLNSVIYQRGVGDCLFLLVTPSFLWPWTSLTSSL